MALACATRAAVLSAVQQFCCHAPHTRSSALVNNEYDLFVPEFVDAAWLLDVCTPDSGIDAYVTLVSDVAKHVAVRLCPSQHGTDADAALPTQHESKIAAFRQRYPDLGLLETDAVSLLSYMQVLNVTADAMNIERWRKTMTNFQMTVEFNVGNQEINILSLRRLFCLSTTELVQLKSDGCVLIRFARVNAARDSSYTRRKRGHAEIVDVDELCQVSARPHKRVRSQLPANATCFV